MSEQRKSRADEIQSLIKEDGKIDEERALELAQRGTISWFEYARLLDYAPPAMLEKGLSFDMRFGPPNMFTRGAPFQIVLPGVIVSGVIQGSTLTEFPKDEGAMLHVTAVVQELEKI